MSDNFKIKYLDKRYNGSRHFNYVLEPINSTNHRYVIFSKGERILKFSKIREWMWATYGPSVELSIYESNECANPLWSWDTDNGNLRIYIKSDKELAFLQLKWS
jgi:hypothetical protein